MAEIIEILAVIISAAELALHAGEVAAQALPDVPSGLKDKYRWIQCTVKNETQFDLLLNGSYFDSGRYWTAPGSSGQFTQSMFSGCNGDSTIFTGVSGGNAFRISLDSEHYFDIAFGWTNPTAGSIKAGVVQSSKAEDGYESATSTGNSITSKETFKGKDEDGNDAKFQIHVSAAPGQEALFVVKQVLVE